MEIVIDLIIDGKNSTIVRPIEGETPEEVLEDLNEYLRSIKYESTLGIKNIRFREIGGL